ncbi:CoB--CoM heterodisulfide reductase iron-sulfur subunit A family protein [candidate division WOR-3 bacterium]|uniref:CoB--CoM heterodisulfide reductase iron-sulfur subunit A family protein n=1 Tax=candidate division WOR-3 bacterium TaxID=2052148 RepID=A0A937XKH7_UNCW3|nr:CoB--CoM heterodisulfide reductase iron-sulfur subunit A family protein [candidate division WOR-3 bacterium]
MEQPAQPQKKQRPRVGVFVCHCGINIAGVVKIPELMERVGVMPGVAVTKDYKYCCSDPGQQMIRDSIKNDRLDRVVVACCSPTLHETTFRNASAEAGLNPYQCEIANIREQCSWVTEDKATDKATEIVRTTKAKVENDFPLEAITVPINKRALVVGAGIAGIQAALDIANAGHEVVLVDKEPSIGGHMAQLSETFPTLDCSQCILTPRTVEAGRHPKIKLMTYSEIESVSGYVGNFKVKVRQKARYVDFKTCTGCGVCLEKCAGRTDARFERGLVRGKAIYRLLPQAVPNRPVIDAKACVYLTKGKCGICAKVCPTGAIRYDDTDKFVEEEVGAIVLATGYELFDAAGLASYGVGLVPDVVDGLAFERLLSASGPTSGEVKRPSDGKVPKKIVFVQCAGSRDSTAGMPYCSKICCMYTAKQAILYKHRVHDGEATICYIDVRTPGKGFEEFYKRATDDGIQYLRGKVSKIFRQGDKVVVWASDTLAGRKVELEADMVVLATAVVASPDGVALARKLKTQIDSHGFMTEAHPKLRPVETLTAGFFLAGCGQGPKDIPETVAQASAAAAKVLAMFGNTRLTHSPTTAEVDEEICVGCGYCERTCAYEAVKVDPATKKAVVNAALCEGCGACAVACPSGAMTHKNATKKAIFQMTDLF